MKNLSYCEHTGLIMVNGIGLTSEQIEALNAMAEAFPNAGQFCLDLKIQDKIQGLEVSLSREDVKELWYFFFEKWKNNVIATNADFQANQMPKLK